MPDDVGDGGLPVSALLDRGGQAVQQSATERLRRSGLLGYRCAHNRPHFVRTGTKEYRTPHTLVQVSTRFCRESLNEPSRC